MLLLTMQSIKNSEWILIDSGYACAGVEIKDRVIINAAPIFKKLIGQKIDNVLKYYKEVK